MSLPRTLKAEQHEPHLKPGEGSGAPGGLAVPVVANENYFIFGTTCAISAYHHQRCEFEPRS